MKKSFLHLFISVIIALLCSNQKAIAQTPYWMLSSGGGNTDEGMDISIDANGNTYTTGYFSANSAFGSVSLSATGAIDIFITKVNTQGVVQWAVKAGGLGNDKGLSIKADASGNCYVTGYFSGRASFGSTTITAVGAQDVFTAKYNTSGVLQWVKQGGGFFNEAGNGITVDDNGNVIVTGQFSDTITFDGTKLISKMSFGTQSPSVDVFTVKYNSSGTLQWIKKGSAPRFDKGIDVAADPSGNIYVIGQFSDTITFDQTHNNNMFNAIFLVKYNSSGTEQWFRRIGGASLNIGYGIVADKNSNVYITGDFQGSQLFFFGTSNVTLSSSYNHNIFVAKYDASGTLLWQQADGSESEVGSRNIALDNVGNIYIVGNFRCKFSEYAAAYGQGTFNSIGYQDIFVAKYNPNGIWQWARNFGGQSDVNGQEDFGYGIAVNSLGQAHITGSFYQRIIFATSAQTTNTDLHTSYGSNLPNFLYCEDKSYGTFSRLTAVGNSDIFITNAIDLDREPYDYYKREGTICERPFVGICINNTGSEFDCSGDSVSACGSVGLTAASRTSRTAGSDETVGPNYTYKWWPSGETTRSISVAATTVPKAGKYSVSITTADGCFTSSDSIYATAYPIPAKPFVSGNTFICVPDSTTLTGGNYGNNTYQWTGPGISTPVEDTSIRVSQSGMYYFTVTNQYNCKSADHANLIVNTKNVLPKVAPKMVLKTANRNDSVDLCIGDGFLILIYDTISNPNASTLPIKYSVTDWYIVQNTPKSWGRSEENTYNTFFPTQSGTYVVSATMTIKPNNDCGGETTVYPLTKTVYVTVIPKTIPNISISITADRTVMCTTGDTVTLTASEKTNYKWTGSPSNGIIGSRTQRTITVNKPGTYTVQFDSTIVTNGCTSSGTATKSITIGSKQAPVVTMFPDNGLVCPGKTVKLTTSGGVTYEWHGPLENIVGTTASVNVSDIGTYYCNVTDASGCLFTVLSRPLIQYSTPSLTPTPSTLLCPGKTVRLNVSAIGGSTIEWQSPLTGSAKFQDVKDSGTYSVAITSCEITTNTSVTITKSNASAVIIPEGPLEFCQGDSVMLGANLGMIDYVWNPGKDKNPKMMVYKSGAFTVTTMDMNGCTAVSDTVKTIVHPIVTPITSDKNICAGLSTVLTASTSYGTLQWFDSLSGGTVLSNVGTYTTPVLNATTTYYVQSSDILCKSQKVPAKITIIPTSVMPAITGKDSLCDGDTLVLSANVINNTTYTWTIPKGTALNQATLTIPNVNSSYSGNYSLVVSGNDCASPSASIAVTVYPTPKTPFLNNNEPVCEGKTLYLSSTPIANATYNWLGPDSFASGLQNPSIATTTLDNDGAYFLTVTVNGCKNAASTNVTINPTPVITSQSNSPICEGETLELISSSTVPYATYQWTGPHSFSSALINPVIPNAIPKNSGEYTVIATLNNCPSEVKKINAEVNPLPTANLGNDTIICMDSPITLHAENGANYLWQDNSTDATYVVTKDGTYSVTATSDKGCVISDAVTVKAEDCTFCVPPVITPNDDGVNDNLQLCNTVGVKFFHGEIFDRWGLKIYEWDDMYKSWDGTRQRTGKKVDDGVYYYIIQITDHKDHPKTHNGFIQVIR